MVKTAPEIWLTQNNNNSSDPDDDNTKDPCDWYFLNIVLDCTIEYISYIMYLKP